MCQGQYVTVFFIYRTHFFDFWELEAVNGHTFQANLICSHPLPAYTGILTCCEKVTELDESKRQLLQLKSGKYTSKLADELEVTSKRFNSSCYLLGRLRLLKRWKSLTCDGVQHFRRLYPSSLSKPLSGTDCNSSRCSSSACSQR
jgi:hypothetical protein